MVLNTGCRPSEAAYLVFNNSFYKTSVYPSCVYLAVVPPEATKTRREYKWKLNESANQAVKLVKFLHAKAETLDHLGDHRLFGKRLAEWFTFRLMVDCAKTNKHVKQALESKDHYNLRSVRARFATDWAAAAKKAEASGRAVPPNPL